MVAITDITGLRFGIDMNNPLVDILATITIMLALIAGGYLYLTYQADKVLQHKDKEDKGQKHEKLSDGKLKAGTFEQLSKRTE